MQRTFLIIGLVLLLMPGMTLAQRAKPPVHIVINGGHVIDPKNNINEIMDVAIHEGKIQRVAKHIEPLTDSRVIDARGMLVTPGLIDIHGHFFPNVGRGDPAPDGFTLRSGVTTAVDAGSSGWRSFPQFKQEIIEKSNTRILAFLNIVGEGFRGNEQDTADMDARRTAELASQHKDVIVGFKVAHYIRRDWIPIDRAIEAGNLADGLPVMVDFGSARPALSLEELLLEKFRPGDIYTHAFGGNSAVGSPVSPGGREAIVDLDGNLKPFAREAQNRGIIFDVGFGGASFDVNYAKAAMKHGFYPNTMGTDMNYHSFNGAMKTILNVMSTFLTLGMEVPELIAASTWEPAQVIQREELGHLSEGAVADVALLSIREGDFGFWDRSDYKIKGEKRLECELTIREGRVVYDLNGISIPDPVE